MERKRTVKERKARAPAHIVSFSSLMIILLAFFIMFTVHAKDRDPEGYSQGAAAFRRELRTLGLDGIRIPIQQLLLGGARRPQPAGTRRKEDQKRTRPRDGEITEVFHPSDLVKYIHHRRPVCLPIPNKDLHPGAGLRAEPLRRLARIIRGSNLWIRIEGYLGEDGTDGAWCDLAKQVARVQAQIARQAHLSSQKIDAVAFGKDSAPLAGRRGTGNCRLYMIVEWRD